LTITCQLPPCIDIAWLSPLQKDTQQATEAATNNDAPVTHFSTIFIGAAPHG
jgi:hypothetical protein